MKIRAGVLEVDYREAGADSGWPVVLLHGFPYDVQAYEEVTPLLVAAGARVITPYLRGFGPTRFLSAETPRSGEQAALGADLLALIDALELRAPIVAGYDWGGRAACVVAALWPERIGGVVSLGSYNLQHLAWAGIPAAPEVEFRTWYQYYFHGERGRAGLMANRHELCKLLWRLWSPTWKFDEGTYAKSAVAFDNPDFIEVVIHSYRHRFGLAAGDAAYATIEAAIANQPPIPVPAITLDGADDGVLPAGGTASHAHHFTGRHEHRVIEGAGHNLPQENPRAFAQAVLALRAGQGC
jgi:pimeloyl-ACP methyl ester carboxylesterase